MKTVAGSFLGMFMVILVAWASGALFMADWKMLTLGAIIGDMGINSTDNN